MSQRQDSSKKNILTIPNALSLFRMILIPVIVWLYFCRESHVLAACVLILSGITDVADGIIARRLNMVSDVGKILDPVADKLTQGIVLLCLGFKYLPLMLLAIVFLIKEAVDVLVYVYMVQYTGKIMGADWHGKALTVLLHTTMLLHLFWLDIPLAVTIGLSIACAVMMLLSTVLYFQRSIAAVQDKRH